MLFASFILIAAFYFHFEGIVLIKQVYYKYFVLKGQKARFNLPNTFESALISDNH